MHICVCFNWFVRGSNIYRINLPCLSSGSLFVKAYVSVCLSLNLGLGLSVNLMYLGESSPKKMRGFMSLTCSIFIGLGKIIGQILGIRSVCQNYQKVKLGMIT